MSLTKRTRSRGTAVTVVDLQLHQKGRLETARVKTLRVETARVDSARVETTHNYIENLRVEITLM